MPATLDIICPACNEVTGFDADVCDGDCPHCGTWITTNDKGRWIEAAPQPETDDTEGRYWDRKIDERRDSQL